MVPTRALRNKAMALLAADTTTLAQAADPNHLILVANNFDPDELLTVDELDQPTFAGYAAIEIELGAQQVGYQPGTDDSVIDFLPPAGGFRFESTAAPDPPQTIYGWAITNEAETTLWCSGKFENPIIINAGNQRIDVDAAQLSLPANAIS